MNRRYWLAAFAFIRMLCTACIALTATACAAQRDRPTDWHDRDSYSGWVTDAVTGAPIEGAVVVAVWRILQTYFIPGIPVSGNPAATATSETPNALRHLRDKQGAR